MRWAACFIGSAERGRSLKITSRLESALNLPLEALLALIPEGILLIDAKRGVSAMNKAGSKLFGLPTPSRPVNLETLGQLFSLKPANTEGIPPNPFLAAYEGKGFESALYHLERAGEPPRLLQLSAMPLLSPAPTQAASSRVLLRAHEVEVAGELPDITRLWQSLLENLPASLYYLDANLIVRLVNPCFLRNSGLAAQEAIGRPLADIFPLNASQLNEMRQVLAQGTPRHYAAQPLRDPLTGMTGYSDTDLFPIVGPNGPIMGMLGISVDVTWQVELSRALSEKVTELEAALKSLREVDRLKMDFLNAISHELRTPLTTIIGYTEFLQDEIAGPLGPEQTSFVCNITESSQHLLAMINDLLDYARLAAGRLPLYVSPINARDLLGELLPTWSLLAQEKQIALTTELSIDLPPVKADQNRLVQVLSNLVDNACKFTTASGQITIRVTHPEPDWIQWEVQDTGIGIPPDALPLLFTTFYQVDSGLKRTQGGTGLGLAISKLLIEAQGGSIGLDSTLGGGTRVWFKLPIWQPADRSP
jgi:PAS domain S-box-containing protein